MSDIGSLIEVFRMNEIDPKTRARIIIKLGNYINGECGVNIAGGIIYELVMLLDPENDIKDKPYYKV